MKRITIISTYGMDAVVEFLLDDGSKSTQKISLRPFYKDNTDGDLVKVEPTENVGQFLIEYGLSYENGLRSAEAASLDPSLAGMVVNV